MSQFNISGPSESFLAGLAAGDRRVQMDRAYESDQQQRQDMLARQSKDDERQARVDAMNAKAFELDQAMNQARFAEYNRQLAEDKKSDEAFVSMFQDSANARLDRFDMNNYNPNSAGQQGMGPMQMAPQSKYQNLREAIKKVSSPAEAKNMEEMVLRNVDLANQMESNYNAIASRYDTADPDSPMGVIAGLYKRAQETGAKEDMQIVINAIDERRAIANKAIERATMQREKFNSAEHRKVLFDLVEKNPDVANWKVVLDGAIKERDEQTNEKKRKELDVVVQNAMRRLSDRKRTVFNDLLEQDAASIHQILIDAGVSEPIQQGGPVQQAQQPQQGMEVAGPAPQPGAAAPAPAAPPVVARPEDIKAVSSSLQFGDGLSEKTKMSLGNAMYRAAVDPALAAAIMAYPDKKIDSEEKAKAFLEAIQNLIAEQAKYKKLNKEELDAVSSFNEVNM